MGLQPKTNKLQAPKGEERTKNYDHLGIVQTNNWNHSKHVSIVVQLICLLNKSYKVSKSQNDVFSLDFRFFQQRKYTFLILHSWSRLCMVLHSCSNSLMEVFCLPTLSLFKLKSLIIHTKIQQQSWTLKSD